ncbi:hypothetical protein [Tenuifilum thalassicum]|uniref:Uncharacterized protein n=1 Tax=Tenuifilum thalassicum TaxID=2590900 RepID=A0A7D4CAN5_9BACT|nr:hypothetical protein [Tenuifilum thalassicum]QKG80862.1 hypothetical protein FHG85_11500 [Tenuifilum thalassicum]
MDYPTTPAIADRYTHLLKPQWDLIHNPISTTGLFDGMEEGAMFMLDVKKSLMSLRLYKNYQISLVIDSKKIGALTPGEKFFKYEIQDKLFLIYEKAGKFSNINIEKTEKYSNFYDATMYQIKLGDFGLINCLSEKDRDIIYDFLSGKENHSVLFGSETLKINEKVYTCERIYRDIEEIEADLIKKNVYYKELNEKERFILYLPLNMWYRGYYYASVFMYNWLTGGGDIQMDEELFKFIDSWQLLKERNEEYLSYVEKNKNRKIEIDLEDDKFRLYDLNDIRGKILNEKDKLELSFKNINNSKNYVIGDLNFGNCSVAEEDFVFDINNPHSTSFGSVSYRYFFEGEYDPQTRTIIVTKVWQEIKDEFNFERFQPLGAWSSSIFEPMEPISHVSVLDYKYNYFNDTFRSFHDKTGIGKDF